MKLFYFGSVCSNEVFNNTVAKSRIKPSASAQNFESALIKGFSNNPEVEVFVASAESISIFPGGNRLFLKKRRDVLTDKITANIIPAINLPAIKQQNHAKGAVKLFKKWLKETKDEEDKCVLIYGIYPKVVESMQKACQKYNCKIYALITDVPSTMFTYTSGKSLLKKLFSGSYREKAIALQDKFDGYIYLTEAMKDEVAPGKPYIVIETIADTSIFDSVGECEKSNPPAIMYAGALYKKYGLDMIVDCFEKLECDSELWLFGSGDYEDEIKRRAEKNPKIKFFGRVSREEVLKRELEATLLVNLRNAEDEYTKYSFPSKMVEYLLSGTPLFTTKLSGVPQEYDSFCFTTEENDVEIIAKQIDAALKSEDLHGFGARAKDFVINEKNGTVQAQKILKFLNQQR